MTVEYLPEGVCARYMRLSAEDGVITEVQVMGGCNGNLQGITTLVKGMRVTELIDKLDGIDCKGRGTSCPAQLAKAARGLLTESEETAEEEAPSAEVEESVEADAVKDATEEAPPETEVAEKPEQ